MSEVALTAHEMAHIHQQSFETPRPWAAGEIAALLQDPACFTSVHQNGFLMGRLLLDEAEILTLAVAPQARRQGIGHILMADFLQKAAQKGAARVFLEVAVTNHPARALYQAHGFEPVGMRKNYYHPPNGPALDALILSRPVIF